MLAKLLTAAAIASLAAAPVVAAPASSLSLAKVSTKGKKSSNLESSAVIIGVLAVAAVVGGAVALANSDDTPDSP